jgi:hypothetical protein
MTHGKLFVQLLCGFTTLAFLAGCGGGSSGSTSTSTPSSISVSVSPATASLGSGGTQSFIATVANDSSNGGVTWSIGSGAGTLSASTSTSVTYTAPAVVSTATAVTLTATSKADTTKSAPAAIAVTPASSSRIAITSVSTSSPTPLTSLQMGTTGINPSNAVTLTFSNSSGFSATEQAVRVQSDGTVIAGVPLYVIPSTGQIGQGTVSLVLTQGTQSSASTSLTIQNLPALSTYGTELGQISHSFLIFEAMLHARRLNEFQAAQQLVGTSVNTASAQTVMQDLINASNLARADVDNVMSNNGTVFSWGSLGGTNLQFNSTQLDAMDRIIAVYLTQQFLSSGSASASSPTSRSRTGKPPIRPELSFGSVGSLLTCLGSNSSACFMQAQEAVQSSPNPTDTSTAWLTGMKATLNLGGAGQDAALPGLALGFVHLSAGLDSLTHAVSDAANCLGSLDGCDAGAQGAIQSELNSAGSGIVSSVTQTISQVPTLLGLEVEQQTVKLADQGIASLLIIGQDGSSGQIAAADATGVSLVSSSTLSQLSGNLGYVTGIAENPTNQSTSSPQNSLDLCCFGASGLDMIALADPNGNYDLLVPIGVAGTNYSDLSLSEDDTATSATLATETVDLSDLSPTATVAMLTLDPPTTPPSPTTPPAPGTYAGSCSAQASAITCCTDGVCSTVPAPPATTEPFDFTLASGTSLSQFTSAECTTADAALSAAGCASSSCNFSASTSTSATFSLSCSVPAVAGCTTETVTETCTAAQ